MNTKLNKEDFLEICKSDPEAFKNLPIVVSAKESIEGGWTRPTTEKESVAGLCKIFGFEEPESVFETEVEMVQVLYYLKTAISIIQDLTKSQDVSL